MNLDEERKDFERWIESNYPISKLELLEKHSDGGYQHRATRNMFDAWQAAKAYEEEKSKGCVMVPVESIEAALLWMDEDIDAHHMSNDGFDKLFEHKPILEKILLEAARGGNE